MDPSTPYRKDSRVLDGKSVSSELDDLALQLKMEVIERSVGNVGSIGESAKSLNTC